MRFLNCNLFHVIQIAYVSATIAASFGRPHGYLRKLDLSRIKVREACMTRFRVFVG